MHLQIPDNDGLFIDDERRLVDQNGASVATTIYPDEGHGSVDLLLQGKIRRISLDWLYLYVRFKIPSQVDIADVYFIRTPQFRKMFPWRALFRKPYWYDKTHRIVPMCATVAVDQHGEVVNISTGDVYHQWKEEYLMVMVPREAHGNKCAMKVHTLVANAWIMKNQDELHPVCNHIDGNKYNPEVSNLEWTSFSENMQHALKNGFLPSRTCILRDRDSGEILEFDSVKQVAAFLGRLPDHLYQSSAYVNRLYNGKYELRVEGDTRPWLYTSDVVVMNDKYTRHMYRVIEPNRIRLFNGTQAFAQYYGLANTNEPLTASYCLKRFRRQYPKYRVQHIDQKDKRPIEVLNTRTGNVHVFDSFKEVVHTIGVNKNNLRYALNTNGRKITDGYRIRYKTNEPWPTEPNKYDPVQVRVTDKTTGEIYVLPSFGETFRRLGLDHHLLRRMARRPHAEDKYLIELIDKKSSETSRKA